MSRHIVHSSDLDDDGDETYHTATEEEQDDDDDEDFAPTHAEEYDDDDEDEDEDDDDDEDDDGGGEGRAGPQDEDEEEAFVVQIDGRTLPLTLYQLHALVAMNNGFLSSVPGFSRRTRPPPDPNRFPKVPSDEGTKLMNSGVFGSTGLALSNSVSTPEEIARRILDRELGIGDPPSRKLNQDLMMQSMIPSTEADMVIRYAAPVYSGQFSDDGNFFFAVGKDFKVRLYDTSAPYGWRYYKTVTYPFGQWTLSDASLSPDNRWLAITSLLPHVCLAPTDPNDTGDPYVLDLSDSGETGRDRGPFRAARGGHFGIFSVRYSGDGRELVAGTNDASIVVYDIESRTVLHKVRGHQDDVNAVCFADKSSPHILYSGSDDTTIKVWDRRSMGDGREAGAFVGHVEGLTYIDSKGDGRYILSNGKDQSMKLWDLRSVMSARDFADRDPTRHTRHRTTDYRWDRYSDDDFFRHPDDNSVVTFRGHRVSRTLIRCHFSPPGSTNSRYVYSGSYDGKVYVWNLDATLAATIDVGAESRRIFSGERGGGGGGASSAQRRRLDPDHTTACVREAFWHPNAPLIVASAWGGDTHYNGFCSVHSYNEAPDDLDDPHMGRLVDQKLVTVSRGSGDRDNDDESEFDDGW